MSNLVNGTSYDLLQYRTVDDAMFHIDLRTLHTSFNLNTLFSGSTNAYGYGWIFWFTQAVITYPAYLFFRAGGSAALLILLPRMLSLVCAAGCSFLMYRLATFYTEKEWLRATVVLLSPVFPTYSYFAGRFGTVCPSAFFGVLAFYLILKDEEITSRRLYQSLSAAAVCVGIKLTGVFILPVLGLLVLSKYDFRFSKRHFKVWIPAAVYFVYLSVFLTAPSLALFPLFPQQAKSSLSWLQWALNRGLNGTGTSSGVMDTISHSVLHGTHPAWVFALLVMFLCVAAFWYFRKKQIRRFDYLCITAGMFVTFTLVVLISHQEPIYTVMYLLPVTALLPLGLCVLDDCTDRWWKRVGITLTLLALLLAQVQFITQVFPSPMEYFVDGIVTTEMKQQIADRKETIITRPVTKESDEKIRILSDWGVQPLTILEYPEYDIALTWDTIQLYGEPLPDYISIGKHRSSLKPEEEWDAYIQSLSREARESAEADKLAVEQLLAEHTLFGVIWELIYEDADCYIFQKCT